LTTADLVGNQRTHPRLAIGRIIAALFVFAAELPIRSAAADVLTRAVTIPIVGADTAAAVFGIFTRFAGNVTFWEHFAKTLLALVIAAIVGFDADFSFGATFAPGLTSLSAISGDLAVERATSRASP